MREARVAKAILKALADPIRMLCVGLLREPPRDPEPDDPSEEEIAEVRKRLAALWLPIPHDDQSERKGYRWPASQLTREDMRKLEELRSQTGRHISVLLHEAVSVLYDLVHSDMVKLEELHLKTGLSIRELLAQAVHVLYDAGIDPPAHSADPPVRLHTEDNP